MKKVFLLMFLTMALMLSSNLKAQTPMTLSGQGGYSWLSGVVGGEIQFGHIGLGGGWMPTSMPYSGDPVSSVGLYGTYYTLPAGQPGYSEYLTVGVASAGYQEETYTNSRYSNGSTSPMTIIMLGAKWQGERGWFSKLGVGYGWCDQAEAFTFEATVGFTLFSNVIK
jgi:hypothetical protein